MTAQHLLWVSLTCNVVLAIGWFLTLGWGETYHQANIRLQRRVRVLTDPDPTCGCTHHYSFHSDDDGCHYTVAFFKKTKLGTRQVLTTCRCLRYVGPEPLPRVISIESPLPEGDEPA